ncbi:hypothetical protein D3C76_1362380 [compost metagenome]
MQGGVGLRIGEVHGEEGEPGVEARPHPVVPFGRRQRLAQALLDHRQRFRRPVRGTRQGEDAGVAMQQPFAIELVQRR